MHKSGLETSLKTKTSLEFCTLVTSAAMRGNKADGEIVQIAPELLLQRFTAASENMENCDEVFKHELMNCVLTLLHHLTTWE